MNIATEINQQSVAGRPMCEVKGCDMTSRFHGFKHDFCWQHYSQWMTQFKYGGEVRETELQKSLDFGDLNGYNM